MLSELSADLLSIHADLALAIFNSQRGAHDKAAACMQDASNQLHALRNDIDAQEAHSDTLPGPWTTEEILAREG